MFCLTREVRFAINDSADDQLDRKPTNSYGGFPSMTGFGRFYTLRVTLSGDLDPATSYLRNIKEIDEVVRRDAIPVIARAVRSSIDPGVALRDQLHPILKDAWPGATLDRLELTLTSTLSLAIHAAELPMIRLSQKFEFSASHRLHSPQLSEEENRKCFGKCNNPLGHGHNYEVQVTVADSSDTFRKLSGFESIVDSVVIDRFDHKNLNEEVPEFRELIPSVENIAKVVFQLLRPHLTRGKSRLASVTVWETPKTWCEYSE